MTESAWRSMLIAFGCGLVAVLSQPPISVPWVLLAAIPALFVLWSRAATPRRAFAVGWAAGVGYFAASLYWIAEAFLVDAATYGWMIPFAMGGISTGLALFWGAGFWFAKRLGSDGWGAPFAFAGGWLVLEWLRGNILTGFPWSLLGYAWVETPAIQSAAIFGIYGVTLWTVLIGALLGSAYVSDSIRYRIVAATAAVIVLLTPFVFDPKSEPKTPSANALLVGLVQPNVAQKDKWRDDLREAHLNDLLAKTRELSERGADVVIWPEAATPYAMTRASRLREMMAAALRPDGVILAGGLRFEAAEGGDRVYNSLVAVDYNAEVRSAYDKQHLVPFGEFLPFDAFLTRLGVRGLAALPGGMSAGNAGGRKLEVPGLPPLVPMICYEAIFPAEIMPVNHPAEWMVQVTNDAWFGRSAGPYQHLAQARVRSIERGLPLARAANTGVSAMIDARGRIRASLALNEPGVLLERLPLPGPRTPYSRYEDAIFAVLVILCLGFGWVGRYRQNNPGGGFA